MARAPERCGSACPYEVDARDTSCWKTVNDDDNLVTNADTGLLQDAPVPSDGTITLYKALFEGGTGTTIQPAIGSRNEFDTGASPDLELMYLMSTDAAYHLEQSPARYSLDPDDVGVNGFTGLNGPATLFFCSQVDTVTADNEIHSIVTIVDGHLV